MYNNVGYNVNDINTFVNDIDTKEKLNCKCGSNLCSNHVSNVTVCDVEL